MCYSGRSWRIVKKAENFNQKKIRRILKRIQEKKEEIKHLKKIAI